MPVSNGKTRPVRNEACRDNYASGGCLGRLSPAQIRRLATPARPHDDLVKRHFTSPAHDRGRFRGTTQHRSKEEWIYCTAVIGAFSRVVVGWPIGDNLPAEFVVRALEMGHWQQKPAPGVVVLSKCGAQYTAWIFGHRLRQAGFSGSKERVSSSVDNALVE